MAKRFLAVCVGVGLGIGLACAAEDTKPTPKPKVDAATVARLVGQLGNERFDDRETACKELDNLGASALEALRPALMSRDEETRRRAFDLIQRIEKRLESVQLTQPKLVRLVYSDTPVAQAVADIAKKTGFTIQIEGDQSKLGGRKITIDTGEVPFWQAVDQFCLKAGLVERGSTAISDNTNPEVDEMRMQRMRMRMWAIEQQGGGMGPRPELPLVFLDGQPKAIPTCYAGALRVRVLPRATATTPQNGTPVNRPDGETLLTIEVTPEPKMGWQNVLNVRVEKMIDEQGNEMKAPLPYIRDTYEFDDEEMMGLKSYRGGLTQGQTHLSKQLPIHVRGVRDMKKIKEVHGAVAAEVLTQMQPLLTIDDILNAAGKTELVSGGGSLKVVEAKRDAKGQVSLKVVVEKHVPGGADAMAARARMWGRVNQPNVDNNKDTIGRMLVLKDDKGVAIPLGSVSSKAVDDFAVTMEYDLTFTADDKIVPAKLVYVGQRMTTIDVPFVLKDVPVP
jgi:hypothetical protein